MGVQTPQIEPKADWLSLDDLFQPRTIEIEMNTMSDVCFVNKWIQLSVIRCLMLIDVFVCRGWWNFWLCQQLLLYTSATVLCGIGNAGGVNLTFQILLQQTCLSFGVLSQHIWLCNVVSYTIDSMHCSIVSADLACPLMACSTVIYTAFRDLGTGDLDRLNPFFGSTALILDDYCQDS